MPGWLRKLFGLKPAPTVDARGYVISQELMGVYNAAGWNIEFKGEVIAEMSDWQSGDMSTSYFVRVIKPLSWIDYLDEIFVHNRSFDEIYGEGVPWPCGERSGRVIFRSFRMKIFRGPILNDAGIELFRDIKIKELAKNNKPLLNETDDVSKSD